MKINNTYTILWIDDDPERKKAAENLKNRLALDIDFIDVKDKSLPDEIKGILSGKEPHLILMDHRLDNVKLNGYKTGATAAEVIREQWPECPIVCVTAVELKDIDLHKQSIYEDIFIYDNIADYESTLLSIAESFQGLKSEPPQNKDDFIKLLKAPGDEIDRLISILPGELKNEEYYQDKSLLLTISRWVR
ncbi:MAG: response regulator, partial [Candidatus Aminicenantes bacterium]|nr:response regulator [Candidatus Aminicenantes bacterium]